MNKAINSWGDWLFFVVNGETGIFCYSNFNAKLKINKSLFKKITVINSTRGLKFPGESISIFSILLQFYPDTRI